MSYTVHPEKLAFFPNEFFLIGRAKRRKFDQELCGFYSVDDPDQNDLCERSDFRRLARPIELDS